MSATTSTLPKNGRVHRPTDVLTPLTTPASTTADSDAFPAPAKEEAFHGVAGEIVRALEPQTEADPVALLIHLLTEVGSIIGRTVYLHGGRRASPLQFVLRSGRQHVQGTQGNSSGSSPARHPAARSRLA